MHILCFLENELIAPILLWDGCYWFTKYGRWVVGDVSVVSDVFYQLFLNAEYHHSDSRHTFILTAV